MCVCERACVDCVRSVCGTLINFSADSTRQRELVQLGAVARLRDVLVCCAAGPPESDQQVRALCSIMVLVSLRSVCMKMRGGAKWD